MPGKSCINVVVSISFILLLLSLYYHCIAFQISWAFCAVLFAIYRSWLCVSCFGFLRDRFFNLGQNICRLFQFLAQFLFSTSETELDYYHWNVNIRVASRAAERRKAQDVRKLWNFKKIPEILGLMASTQPSILMPNFDVFGKQLQKINCKTFHRKTYFA